MGGAIARGLARHKDKYGLTVTAALQTIKGAADLALAHGTHPEAEIDKVTTPGGITIRGLNAMEKAGFSAAVIAGLTI